MPLNSWEQAVDECNRSPRDSDSSSSNSEGRRPLNAHSGVDYSDDSVEAPIHPSHLNTSIDNNNDSSDDDSSLSALNPTPRTLLFSPHIQMLQYTDSSSQSEASLPNTGPLSTAARMSTSIARSSMGPAISAESRHNSIASDPEESANPAHSSPSCNSQPLPVTPSKSILKKKTYISIVDVEEDDIDRLPNRRYTRRLSEFDTGFRDADRSAVDKKELLGWYGFGWASEGYSVCAISVFIPIILESLAAESGYVFPLQPFNGNGTMSEEHRIMGFNYMTCDSSLENYKCVVPILGNMVDTASFSLYVVAISVALQAIVFVGLGALADFGSNRKTLLIFFSFLGSATCLGFAFLSPHLYIVAGLLTIISNLSFGASYVFYHAFIPLLTRHHSDVLKSTNGEEKMEHMDRIANKISTNGLAIGYLGGIFLLVVCSLMAWQMGGTTFSLQLSVTLTGVWWFVFTFIPYFFLKPRAGPLLPKTENYLFYSWKRVYKTVRQAKRLTEVFKFLFAWFLLSDGYSTIVSVAILFAKTVLLVPRTHLILLAIVAPIAAVIGNYFFLYLSIFFKISTKHMIMLLCMLYTVIPVYGLLGFFVDSVGLKNQWEVWWVAAYHGLLLGATQSFSRVLFSEIIPVGSETEFFSLFSITDKGSAWVGPLVSALISDSTHDLRYTFWFLLGMLILPALVFMSVDVGRAKKQAVQFAEEEILQEAMKTINT